MAINLSALNASEATLVRPQIQPAAYRLNTDKIKENWEQLKSESKDMVQISGESAACEGIASIDALKGTQDVRCNAYNYSLDAFFRKDMPQITTDGGYMVGGAYFSKEELEQCRMVLKTAADNIGCGIGKNTNIDYKNYAQMGIAVSMVKNFAGANLTEEQAAVVNQAMQEYNAALVDMEKEIMSDGSYVDSQHAGLSDYYGKERVLRDAEIEAINKLKKELGKLTGRYYEPSQSGMTAGVQSATNRALIDKITDLFSNMDCTDAESVDSAMENYMAWMEPAYTAYGINRTSGSLAGILHDDIAGFKNQISDMLMALRYHAADYSV